MCEEQAALGQNEAPGQSGAVCVSLRVSDALEMAVLLQSRKVIFPLQACRKNTQLVTTKCQYPAAD